METRKSTEQVRVYVEHYRKYHKSSSKIDVAHKKISRKLAISILIFSSALSLGGTSSRVTAMADVPQTEQSEMTKESITLPIAGTTKRANQILKQALNAKDSDLETEAEKLAEKRKHYKKYYTEADIRLGAIVMTGEAGGMTSKTEKSAVLWAILNRVDCKTKFANTVYKVVTAPHQFEGYSPEGKYSKSCYDLSRDVFERWNREKNGETNVGRTLPKDYFYFTGDGYHNNYKKEWRKSAPIYKFDFKNSPYES